MTVGSVMDASLTVTGPVVAADGPSATDLRAETAADGARGVSSRCGSTGFSGPPDQPAEPGLSAAWRLPDGTQPRGILATAEHMPGPRPADH